MPICLNCEVELPAGTELCPHCNEPVEEEVATDEGGGILAGAWDEQPLTFSDSAPPAAEPEEADVEPPDLPAADPELPARMSANARAGLEDLPAAAPEIDDADAKKAERERRKAERAARRAAEGTGSGDEEAPEKPAKRERAAKDKEKAKGKTRETRPAGPPKSVTLAQHRKAVAFAALSWLLFVALFSGAFVKGLLYPDPAASKANMANILFGVLGLASFLFLWAHLKMGRYMAVTSALVALGVEGFFFFNGKENFASLTGVGVFFFTQFLLLTGSGWVLRVLLGFVLVLLSAVLFAVPHAVDVVLARGAAAQETRARQLLSGAWVYTKDAGDPALAPVPTAVRALGKDEVMGENDQRATVPQVWDEMLAVADAFEESERLLTEWPASIGVDLVGWKLDGLLLKPRRREHALVETVIPSLFGVLRGDPNAKDWGMRNYRAAREQSTDAPPTPEENAAWDALAAKATERLLAATARYLGAEPSRGTRIRGSFRVTAKVLPHRNATTPVEVQLSPSGTSRYMTFHEKWIELREDKTDTALDKIYFGQDYKTMLDTVQQALGWSLSEATNTFNCIRRLGVLEATILVETLEEAPAEGGAGGEKPAGEGEGGEEKPAGEGGGGDEKPADEGGEEKPADEGGGGGG